MRKILPVIICFCVVFSLAGKTKLDSLLADIKNNPSDTAKSLSCSFAGFEYILANKGDSAVRITQMGYEIAKRKDFLKGMAKCIVTEGVAYTILNDAAKAKQLLLEGEKIWLKLSASKNKKDQYFAHVGLGSLYNNLAIQYSNNGDLNEALSYHNKALAHRKLAGDKIAIANSCNNISVIHEDLGNVSEAIEFCFRALKIYEDLKDSLHMAKVFGNLGLQYQDLRDYDNALDYSKRAMLIGRRAGDAALTGSSLNNMGSVYLKTGKVKEAIDCFNESLEIYKKIGNKMEQSNIISNLGGLYLKTGDKKQAFPYLVNALILKREIDDKVGESVSLGNIAEYFLETKDYRRAITYADSALVIAQPLGNISDMKDYHRTLFKAWSKIGNYEKALYNYEQHILLNDSIMKEENKKAGIKKQLQYDYAKKTAADSIKNLEFQKVKDAELAAQNAKLKQERFQRYSLVVGLLIVLVGLGFVINRFRITSKQKKIIEEQKKNVDAAFDKLAEKNKEVMDSIHYAKRIQKTLMTSNWYVERNWMRMRENLKNKN